MRGSHAEFVGRVARKDRRNHRARASGRKSLFRPHAESAVRCMHASPWGRFLAADRADHANLAKKKMAPEGGVTPPRRGRNSILRVNTDEHNRAAADLCPHADVQRRRRAAAVRIQAIARGLHGRRQGQDAQRAQLVTCLMNATTPGWNCAWCEPPYATKATMRSLCAPWPLCGAEGAEVRPASGGPTRFRRVMCFGQSLSPPLQGAPLLAALSFAMSCTSSRNRSVSATYHAAARPGGSAGTLPRWGAAGCNS